MGLIHGMIFFKENSSERNLGGGEHIMNKIQNLIMKGIAFVVFAAAISGVNGACNLVLYEPGVPEELK